MAILSRNSGMRVRYKASQKSINPHKYVLASLPSCTSTLVSGTCLAGKVVEIAVVDGVVVGIVKQGTEITFLHLLQYFTPINIPSGF